MARLIDADALKLTGCHVMNKDGSRTIKAAVMEEDLDNAPTIDAIPIDYMRSQIDCEKWEEIITRWKEHDQIH